MSEVIAQVNRIQQMGSAGTGVSYARFARAAGRVASMVRTGQNRDPLAKRYQTNTYLLNQRSRGLSNG